MTEHVHMLTCECMISLSLPPPPFPFYSPSFPDCSFTVAMLACRRMHVHVRMCEGGEGLALRVFVRVCVRMHCT